jgi:23S rRNA pseudouridine2457 synthase
MAKQFILFYKPYNVLSQFSAGQTAALKPTIDRHSHADSKAEAGDTDAPDRLTLKNFIPIPGVYPVGRLDRDSEGLMLLTNDGRVQHRLSHPRFAHTRTYWVQVERIPGTDAIQQLQHGVMIKGYQTLPCRVERLPDDISLPPRDPPIRWRKSVPTAWLSITLKEGKNRQVRRMTAAVGHPTLRLVRVALGPLALGDLCPGQWRDATPYERQQILAC